MHQLDGLFRSRKLKSTGAGSAGHVFCTRVALLFSHPRYPEARIEAKTKRSVDGDQAWTGAAVRPLMVPFSISQPRTKSTPQLSRLPGRQNCLVAAMEHTAMDNVQIVQKINDARDAMGVIHQDAFQNELGSFTSKDWQQAARIYAKDSAKDTGFYIEDTPGGKITIHNDMKQAESVAGTTALADVSKDVKTTGAEIAGAAVGLYGAVAAAGGVAAAAMEGGGLAAAAVAGTGLAVELAPLAAVVAATGAIVLGADVAGKYLRHAEAQADLKDPATISSTVSPRAHD